jgi:hypothetical protein
MVNVARKWCRDRDVDPDDTIRMVERRRGDRVVEPLHAPHETIVKVPGRSFNQITSPHDVHAEVLVA